MHNPPYTAYLVKRDYGVFLLSFCCGLVVVDFADKWKKTFYTTYFALSHSMDTVFTLPPKNRGVVIKIICIDIAKPKLAPFKHGIWKTNLQPELK